MQAIPDFFGDPLIVPVYFYIAGWGIVWLLAFVLGRLLANPQVVGSYDGAAVTAWVIAILLHILGGSALVFWLCMHAIPRVSAGWHIPFYLIPYLVVVAVDILALFSVGKHAPSRFRKRKSAQKG